MGSRYRRSALLAVVVITLSVMSYGNLLRWGILIVVFDRNVELPSRSAFSSRGYLTSSSQQPEVASPNSTTANLTLGERYRMREPAQRQAEVEYLSHRFQVEPNATCQNDLMQCDVVYDAECIHICEKEVFHRIESCLVPAYPLIQRAREVPKGNKTACLLYDDQGFLRDEVFDLVKKDWPDSLVTIPYHAKDQSAYKRRCYKESKLTQRSLCFNVKKNAEIVSTADYCNDTCIAADNFPQVVNDIQQDFAHTWGPLFHNKQTRKRDTVVLIGRQDEKRRDARSFRHLEILDSVLRPHVKLKIYDGSTPSFSKETAALFASAKVVIGYHGAGFANLLFSHTNSSIVAIEMFAKGCSYEQYFNKRIAHWGFQWKQLVLGTFTNGVVDNRTGTVQCRWVDSVVYNHTEIGRILREVLSGLETRD